MTNCEAIRSLEWHNKNEKFNIPTKFSAQIIVNTKQIYVNIEEYYTKENLKSVFQTVLDDIIKYYIGTFAAIKIDNKTSALRWVFSKKVLILFYFIIKNKRRVGVF